MKRSVFGLSLAFALSLGTSIASADVPPPDMCLKAGEACDNAPPDYTTPGTCADSTCVKGGPDGSTEYPCLLCKAGSAGAGGSSGNGSGGSSGSGTGGTAGGSAGSPQSSGGGDDDGGCSVRGHGTGSLGLGLLALALGALALERRRRA